MKSGYRRFGRTAAAILFTAAFAASAAAQDKAGAAAEPTAQHVALARSVVEFTGATRAFDAVIPQLLEQARTTVLGTHPDLRADLDQIVLSLTDEFVPHEKDLIDRIARVYAKRFTEPELNAIYAFYKSEAGQKLNKTTPEILRETYGIVQEWGQKLSVEIMNRVREELKKRGKDI